MHAANPIEIPAVHRVRTMRHVLADGALFLALITTGLSAGFFYAWQVGSIPGLRLLDDVTYIQTMNAVNSTIQNAGFAISFFGSFVCLLTALFLRLKEWRSLAFGLLLAACLAYLFGLLLITVQIHIPLNRGLLAYTDLTNVDNLAAIRAAYESSWNQWHLVRTYGVFIAFVALLGATFAERRQ